MTEEMSRVQRNAQTSRKQPKKNSSKAKRYAKYTILTLATLGVVGALGGAGVFAYYASSAPKITNSALVGTSQTQLLDADGNVFYTTGSKREMAKQSEIPKEMRMAVVSIEDRRFYKHHGVDPRRILGAAFANFTGSSLGLQGGSTLTQQLIKLTAFSTAASDQTIKRKAQEAWLALKLEKEYSKNQILTLYMNKVYMGNGVYGMKTAAEYYFGKDLKNLSTPQMALLAGLPQSPSGYDPYVNPKGAKARRDEVLEVMAQNNVITQAQAKKYMALPVTDGLMTTHPSSSTQDEEAKVDDAYIMSTLAEIKKLGYDVNKDGLTVQTNLNQKVQDRAYAIGNTADYVNWKDDDMQVGMTVTDPNNGKVIAQLGGRNLTALQGTNRATNTVRSSGSTAKPIVDYGPAVENLGWSTNHLVLDTPYTYPGTNIQPNDWDHKFMGSMTMRNALAQSRNLPAIRTLQEVGYTKSLEFLKKLGIDIPANEMVGSSAIGINVSTEQEAAAYAAFANGGTYYRPQYISKITEQSGVVKDYKAEGSTAMKSSTAFMLTNMMKSVITDSYAKMINTNAYSQAGKTGVVGYEDGADVPDGAAHDTWFTGFTKSASISVWTGYDRPNEPGHYLAEGEEQYVALHAYKALMDYVMSGGDDGSDWTMPDTVRQVTVNGIKEYQVVGADVANEKTIGGTGAVSTTRTPTVQREQQTVQQSVAPVESSTEQPASETPTSSSESSAEERSTSSSQVESSASHSESQPASSTSNAPSSSASSTQPASSSSAPATRESSR